MQRSTLLRGAAVLALAALSACDAPPTTAPKQETDDLARRVEALGFRSDAMVDFGSYVVVEGDIRLEKSRLPSVSARRSSDPGPRFQYRTTALVGSPRVHQITVDLTGLAAEPDWQNAARAALPLWSGIANSYVRIVEAAPGIPADITFALGCLPSNWAAGASWPAGGNPGPTITVNRIGCIGFGQNNQQRLHNMVHELGHTLGFRHTNWSARGEQNDPLHIQIGAVHIAGTPTGNDNGSVMNGGTAANAWAGFSAADLLATRTLYPLPVPAPTLTYVSGQPVLSWAPLVGATGYVVRRITVSYGEDEFGTWTSYGNSGTISGASSPFTDTYWTHTGNSLCRWDWEPRYWMEHGYGYAVDAQFPTGTTTGTVGAETGVC